MRLDRQSILSSAQVLFEAKAKTVLRLWYIREYTPETTSSQVFIAMDPENCTMNKGTPMPDNSFILTLNLEAGQQVWAITAFQALVGMVIED